MGRMKIDKSSLRKSWIEDLKVNNIMKIGGAKIICFACQDGFSFKQKCEMEQHIQTRKHQNSAKKFLNQSQRQSLLIETVEAPPIKTFNSDLCRAFVSALIPWNKLKNPDLEGFLQKYTGKTIPDESTLRKNYLPNIYNSAIEKIRRDVGLDPIWLQIDETTDKCGRFIANVIIGSLRKDNPTKSHLICSTQLDKTNNSTVTKCVLDALQLLWPGSKQDDIEKKFLLLITDGVEYMIKAGKNLKTLYGKLLHVTCIAHGMNRVAEDIRSHFPEVDKFVANMKAAFKKAPRRIAIYKAKYPDLPLPPSPVITRWGTWLSAVEFYANHFDKIKDIVKDLPDDSASVKALKTLVSSPELPRNLAFLTLNYTFLAAKLKEMQEKNSSLRQSLQYLDDIESKLFSVRGNVGKSVIEKFKSVIGKNPDLEKLKGISAVLEGNDADDHDDPTLGLNPAEIASFQFAPITSVEAERSFSMHKFLLSDRRHGLTPENLEMELISHFELLHDDDDN
ncbi:CGG triplet repeat-binding protein 1 [Folsomia candida]|uniref:CGG triplet repeat-binding protein 1 n=1 Tax=Folsomia candida TaxID=158441 RepID=A0A226DA75_FOLCA|nr:CGG triplet repeat-binding protein 1 [Folsomia candida]